MIKMLGSRILVEYEFCDKTTGGIILPESQKQKGLKGKVVSVGSGYMRKNGTISPLEVKVGDHIMFGHYALDGKVVLDNKEYIIMDERDIILIIPENIYVDVVDQVEGKYV